MRYFVTPDGRYFVVRGRLWRCANPDLHPNERARLTRQLMSARREKKSAMRRQDAAERDAAARAIDAAKRALGERGPVWWTDNAPDLSQRMVRNTPYATWFSGLENQMPKPSDE